MRGWRGLAGEIDKGKMFPELFHIQKNRLITEPNNSEIKGRMGGGEGLLIVSASTEMYQKNIWEGFVGSLCEVRASSLYQILSRLTSITG